MEINEIFEIHNPEDWLSAIEPYQMTTFKEMGFDGKNYDIIAQKWLKASTSQTFPFGTEVKANPFFDNLKKEIIKLICDENAYLDIKEQIRRIPGGSPVLIVSTISAGLAPIVGTAHPLINPVVSLILYSFGKITKNAFCKTYYSKE